MCVFVLVSCFVFYLCIKLLLVFTNIESKNSIQDRGTRAVLPGAANRAEMCIFVVCIEVIRLRHVYSQGACTLKSLAVCL